MILFGLGLTAAAGAVTGLVSGIPAAGPVIAAILSLPLWGLMLLGILLILALMLSLKLVPVIVASTGGDSFEAVFELFSTLTAQSWRLMLYFLLGLLISVLAGAAFLLFASAALTMISILTGAGSGLAASMAQGPQLLAPEALPFFSGLLSLGGGGESAAWTGAAGVIAALSGTVIFLTVVSYVIASCISSATLSYVVLKYRKDGVDLMERADREEQREFEKLYGGSEKDVK